MIKKFLIWLFNYSVTIQQIHNSEKRKLVNNIRDAMEVNQCKHLSRKWNRITKNKNSPFYIYE